MPGKPTQIRWVANTSDGRQVVELEGEYIIKEGARKPWVRFCDDLARNGHFITGLRLWLQNEDGQRIVNMPRPTGRFNPDAMPPDYYSLEYIAEVDDVMGNATQDDFIAVAAHYGSISVHFIQQVNDSANSWVEVRHNYRALAASPQRK